MRYAFPLIILGILVLYYLVNPSSSYFPFHCPWHLLTGTQCPSCGIQRAIYALLHGEFVTALRYNLFLILSLPYVFLVILVTWYNFNHVFDKLYAIVYHRYAIKAYIVVYFAWWIIRNILGI